MHLCTSSLPVGSSPSLSTTMVLAVATTAVAACDIKAGMWVEFKNIRLKKQHFKEGINTFTRCTRNRTANDVSAPFFWRETMLLKLLHNTRDVCRRQVMSASPSDVFPFGERFGKFPLLAEIVLYYK